MMCGESAASFLTTAITAHTAKNKTAVIAASAVVNINCPIF